MSTRRTFRSRAASAAPRLIAVVVLPTPPFWFAIATILPIGAGIMPRRDGSTGNVPRLPLSEESEDPAVGARDGHRGLERKRGFELSGKPLRICRPRHEVAARPQETGLSERRAESPDRADRRETEAGIAQIPGALFQDFSVSERKRLKDVAKKGGALLSGFQQRHPEVRAGDCERKTGEAGARSNVNNSYAMRN